MWTFDQVRRAMLALGCGAVCAATVAACAPSGDCTRYSDCDLGLTCANGKCVVPPPPQPVDPDGAAASGATVSLGVTSGASGGGSSSDDAALTDDSTGDAGATGDAPVE